MNDLLVRAEGVSKKFCRNLKRSLWYGLQDMASELFCRDKADATLRPCEFWALRDVSFKLRRGECLGLIGPNGAGKSTLLKLLNGIIKPDGGQIHLRGRVGGLIELGAGFHPTLTGRENIYVNGAVLGLSKPEVNARLNRIIEFADIGDAIDAPVRTYSSGMRVRLGFAVASNLNPDVLLIDEVLAVGDAGFRARCYDAIGEMLADTAIILVSHNMAHISRMSDRVLLTANGTAEIYDVPSEGIDRYLSVMNKARPTDGMRHENGGHVQDIRVTGETPENGCVLGRPLNIGFVLELDQDAEDVMLYMTVLSGESAPVAYASEHLGTVRGPRRWQIRFTMDELPLSHGNYSLSIVVRDRASGIQILWYQAVAPFHVEGEPLYQAGITMLGKWDVREL